MEQFVVETRIKNGHIELNNIPFPNDTEVKIITIPKTNLKKLSFNEVQQLTESIKGNLSDDVIIERDGK